MQSFPCKIEVEVASQRLNLYQQRPLSSENGPEWTLTASYPVSTSAYGLGTEPGSLKTPLGRFFIAEKFGDGAPLGAVFVSRQPTGEIAPLESPGEQNDLITTRILWLAGSEPHNANTYSRYIYIHGTNHEESIGVPSSHGCIRMRNADIVELFASVELGTEVFIIPPPDASAGEIAG